MLPLQSAKAENHLSRGRFFFMFGCCYWRRQASEDSLRRRFRSEMLQYDSRFGLGLLVNFIVRKSD